MRFGPVGIWEIVVIVTVVLLIFGPALLPKLARNAGKAVKTARDVKDEITGVVLDDEEASATQKRSTSGSSNTNSNTN